ncbi:MAG: DUF3823 domain-containing protein [Prevotellaceae bacterium]|jgi:hypothetical protein|nr:DUF3823 domain-containing protein [Prevotellaceae bacterium]
MKTTLHNATFAALVILVAASCGIDNYEKPASRFSGRVTHNGQPIGVSGIDRQNFLQFWQDGYELRTEINCHLTQDGSYSAMLFDGDYKLVMNNNRGPWVNRPDTVAVAVNGNTVKNYEVTPYYMLSNIAYTVSGKTLSATVTIAEITAGRPVETLALMINKTAFVDNQSSGHLGDAGWTRQSDVAPGTRSLSLDLSGQTAKTLYARVGIKISGIDQWQFDPQVYEIKN